MKMRMKMRMGIMLEGRTAINRADLSSGVMSPTRPGSLHPKQLIYYLDMSLDIGVVSAVPLANHLCLYLYLYLPMYLYKYVYLYLYMYIQLNLYLYLLRYLYR